MNAIGALLDRRVVVLGFIRELDGLATRLNAAMT
jgi:hypothetical protein